ncbi:MaoC family dehydratase [Pedobacter mendelii]|uniref:Acyl dehydratase n=1 Tax=Pedobacter mendelii TaxID=1908240 RepID=A0ABQ2BMZ5_9SPHI|nr:MaoC family dehydratase [Pedobacter mendelii]GGI28467.1 acyl dehydratase [Pedobacter mendelii]
MQIITSHAEFEQQLGKELGVSSWHTITQQQINKFADATLDYQWIHVDEEKAKNDGPFGTTIAHGYLTLSLIPYLWKEIVDIQNLKMEINYGIESLRFAQPVKVNSKIRLKAKLASIINLRGVTKVHMGIEMEIEDQKKPAFTGEVVFLYHFITA